MLVKEKPILNIAAAKNFGEYLKNDQESENPLKNVFIPNWENRPPELPSVLSLAGVPILTHQNLAAIIAAQGMGKSSLSEAICAAHLNTEADCLGFEGDLNYKGLIYADFERTNTDVWNSFYRMAKRAGLQNGDTTDKVVMVGLRSVPRLAERLEAIEQLLIDHPCSLLLLDGAGDLVTDTNDLGQAIECRILLREWTVKYDISIFTTLHPNPGTIKPRGHLGSEIIREAESVMLVQNYENGVRVITTDFENGKNRNNGQVTSAYSWDDTKMMFLTADLPQGLHGATGTTSSKRKMPIAADYDDDVHIKLLQDVFKHQAQQTSTEFLNNIMALWDGKENGDMKLSRAKLFKSYYVLNDFIIGRSGQTGNKTLNEIGDKYKNI